MASEETKRSIHVTPGDDGRYVIRRADGRFTAAEENLKSAIERLERRSERLREAGRKIRSA